MRTTTGILAVLGALCLMTAAQQAQAQTAVGFNAQYGLDFEEFQVGAEFIIPFTQVQGLSLVPNVEIYLRDDPNVFSINGDVHYMLDVTAQSFTPYFGLGLAVTHVEFERGGNTEAGFNIIGGANFRASGATVPFFQIEYRAGDYEDLSIGGGVRVRLR